MDIDGYPWIFGFAAVAWGLPWDPKDVHGHPWIAMDIYGYLGFLGFQWDATESQDHPWLFMDIWVP